MFNLKNFLIRVQIQIISNKQPDMFGGFFPTVFASVYFLINIQKNRNAYCATYQYNKWTEQHGSYVLHAVFD